MEGRDPMRVLERPQPNNSYELLSTKLTFPRLRLPLVPRQQLLERLDQGLAHKLTLISAPAGFGKTTLVAEWISERMKDEGGRMKSDLGRESLHPSSPILHPSKFAWVSLDAGDNDPVRFWRYALTACSAFEGEVSRSALHLLQGPQGPPFEAVLTTFINELAQLPAKNVLVLEDYHLVTSRQVHDTLAFLLDYLPPALHIILLTRSDPPLPLARLRAQNALNELRAADLRFSLEEIRAFLQQAIPFPLPPEAVTRLAERTEGWPAGLHLVTLALQGRQEPPEAARFLTTFTGSHRPILEYLVADVFAAQPEPVQEFLLQTSILSRLSGSLCEAVTGRSDSSAILLQLEKANLFLAPLDGAGQWYRYHDLFAEAMRHYARQRLGEARLRELAHQASFWYEEHGMLAEAVEASLSAGDARRAGGLIGRIIAPRLVQNEFHTLRRWMEQIPEDELRTHPEICMTYAVAILFTSDRHSPATKALLQTPLEIAEEHWRREENEPRLGEILAFRSLVAWLQREYEQSFSLARQALRLLPEGDVQWRGISLIMVGVEEFWAGRLNAARQTLIEARALCEAAENIYGTLDSALLLGEVATRQGELNQAAQLYREVQARTENAPMNRDQVLIRRGRVLLGLGALALEWNDLQAAERDVSQAVEVVQQFPEEDLLANGPLVLARVKAAQGETAQAQQMVRSFIAQTKWPLLSRGARAVLARIDLASGNLAAVQRWAETEALPGDEIPLIQHEQEVLVLARLMNAQAEAGEALRLLESWQVEARDNGRTQSELEILILKALAHTALGDAPQSRQALIQALKLGQPEGYQRLFLDEGEPMRLLIEDCRLQIDQKAEKGLLFYVDQLLFSFRSPQKIKNQQSTFSNLLEPLSEQEARVLRLLSAGLTNPEIAQELIVSTNTVKSHVKSIYRKLNVNSRREAREVARRLKLV